MLSFTTSKGISCGVQLDVGRDHIEQMRGIHVLHVAHGRQTRLTMLPKGGCLVPATPWELIGEQVHPWNVFLGLVRWAANRQQAYDQAQPGSTEPLQQDISLLEVLARMSAEIMNLPAP